MPTGRSEPAPPVVDADLPAVSADFAGEFELDSVRVDGGECAGAVGEGTITAAVVERVDLSNAKLDRLTLANTVLRNVELSNASVQQVVARRVELRTCRAIGLRLSFEHATDLSIVDCRLDYATLHVEKVKGVAVFAGCSFREATISGDLSNIRFADCDFVDTEFRARRAANCDFRTSRFAGAKGLLSLRGATIGPDQAITIAGLIAAEAGLIVAG